MKEKYQSSENQPFLFEGGDEKTPSEYQRIATARQKAMNVIKKQREAAQDQEVPEEAFSDGAANALKYFICTQFWFKFVIYATIIILAYFARSNIENPCGIDPIFWILVFFSIALFAAFCELMIYFFIACCKVSGGLILGWYSGTAILSFLALIGWAIYGLMLYFSPENDCQSSPDEFGWLVVMIILLFFFLIAFCFMAIALCVAACILCCAKGSSNPLENDKVNVMKSAFYDPSKYKFSETCAICQEDYKRGDKITTLKCDEKHYFHNQCIEEHVSHGNLNCPLCNARIDQMDDDDAPGGDDENKEADMMMGGGD